MPHRAAIVLMFCSLLAYADLKPETLKGYQNYIRSLEPRLKSQNASTKDFLWIDKDAERRQSVRDGEIETAQIKTPNISGGLIQHWVGGVFIPNVRIDQVIRVDQDYNRHKVLYAPDVADSRIINHQGNHFKIFLRFRKHKVLTVVLNSEHDVDYHHLAPGKLFSNSVSTKIQEVKNPDTPDEKVLPVGEGMGFLWAMNTYWRMLERDGGVYAECEAITLARNVPPGLGGMIGPIIQSLASDSLTTTLTTKRKVMSTQK